MKTLKNTRNLTEKLLGHSISNKIFNSALKSATIKLSNIISREGDKDGERRKDFYLAQLIAEDINCKLFSMHCTLKCIEKKQKEKAPRLPASALIE